MSVPAFKWTAPAVGEVTLRDRIFSHLERNNISVTIPTSLQKCHDTGRIDAFKLEMPDYIYH